MRLDPYLALGVSVCAITLGGFLATTTAPHDIESHCLDAAQLPPDVDPLQVYGIDRDFEFFPLGLNCSWSVGPDDREVHAAPNWIPSILFYGGIAGTIGFPTAAHLQKVRRPRGRNRGGHNGAPPQRTHDVAAHQRNNASDRTVG